MRRLLLSFVIGSWLMFPVEYARAQATNDDAAEIVLVGAADSAELQRVVRELLTREGVDAVFLHADRFASEALLAEPDGDRRVRVFITLATTQLARLYMRGPNGRRFLLRELTLRSGIDELGRESIAHVAATSTHALLHSSVGIDRDAARADLDRQGVATSSTVRPSPTITNDATPAPADASVSFGALLGLRDTVRWTGSALGARWGAGAEVGLSEQALPWLMFRQRLVFEHSIAQTLDVPELLAHVQGSALRLGQDVALMSGAHRAVLGLALGVDVLHVDPRRARDASWTLAPSYTELVPTMRAELRYELVFSWVFAALAVHVDAATRPLRFEVRDGSEKRTVAQASWFTPGASLSLGWHSN